MVMEFKECKKLNDKQIEDLQISEYDKVKLIKQGDVYECKWSSVGIQSGECYIQKIDKEHYMVKKTGEVKEYKSNTMEIDGKEKVVKMQKSLLRTFTRLRALINTNFTMSDITNKKVLFLTLTYAEQVEGKAGNEKLLKDFNYFIKKLTRKYKEQGKPEYINVVEPQASGRWHCHCLLKWSSTAPFIPFDVLNDLWPHGYVKVNLVGYSQPNGQAANQIDNLGAYLTAYLTDLPIEDMTDKEIEMVSMQSPESIVEKNGKKYVKGARLWMYSDSMKIYRCSQGIKQPQQTIVDYGLVQDMFKGCLTYQKCKEVIFEDLPPEDEQPANVPKEVIEAFQKEKGPQGMQHPGDPALKSVFYLTQYYNINRIKKQ